jgi:hypothetical protein
MTTDHKQLSAQVAEVLAAVDPIGVVPGNPDPVGEYWPEAETIASEILRGEVSGRSSDCAAIAKILRSVLQSRFERRIPRREAKAIASEILARRLWDLMHAIVAEEAAPVLADGRAVLRRHDDLHGSPAIELDPVRPAAAGLIAFIEYDRLVHCSINETYDHEVYSNDPLEIADEVRGLVRALIEGTYSERQKDGRHHSTVRAEWPGGGSSTADVTAGAGGWQTEWRSRAYEPY